MMHGVGHACSRLSAHLQALADAARTAKRSECRAARRRRRAARAPCAARIQGRAITLTLSLALMRRAHAAAQGFIREFFDQNPLSHLGLIVLRNGVAERLTDLSGSPVRPPSCLNTQLEVETLPHPTVSQLAASQLTDLSGSPVRPPSCLDSQDEIRALLHLTLNQLPASKLTNPSGSPVRFVRQNVYVWKLRLCTGPVPQPYLSQGDVKRAELLTCQCVACPFAALVCVRDHAPLWSPQEAHIAKLRAALDCGGDASLMNALEAATDALKSIPPYGHREARRRTHADILPVIEGMGVPRSLQRPRPTRSSPSHRTATARRAAAPTQTAAY